MKKSLEDLLKSARKVLEKGQDEKGNPIRGSNKRLQQAKTFGKPSDAKKDKKGVWQTKIPDANGDRISDQRHKMMHAIKRVTNDVLNTDMRVATGHTKDPKEEEQKGPKIARETYDVFSKEGMDQERRRSAKIKEINAKRPKGAKRVARTDIKPFHTDTSLETQPSPDAAVHEVAHEMIAPAGMGNVAHQKHMNEVWGRHQSEHGHMQQKKTADEIQTMAVENRVRRMAGLPANRNALVDYKPTKKEGEYEWKEEGKKGKVKGPLPPIKRAIDGTGDRVVRARNKDGRVLDLDRQSRLLGENEKKMFERRTSGIEKRTSTGGWRDVTKDPVSQKNIHAKINASASGQRDIKQDSAKIKEQKQKKQPELRVDFSTHPGSSILVASEAKVSRLKDRLSKAKKR